MSAGVDISGTMPGVSAGVYRQADFEAVRVIIHREAGIVLSPGKEMLVYSRLAPLVRQTGSDTFARYVKLIEEHSEERRKAVSALTTNHTFFSREPHHFEHFATHVRPSLVRRARAGESMRIWSAGCATGEETWTLAMTLLGEDRAEAQALLNANIRILATDISAEALNLAKAAVYPIDSVARMRAGLRKLWTTERDGTATLDTAPRKLASFRTLNLLAHWPLRRQFEVIFCRNVMIYFDQPTKDFLVERFAEQLMPGGFLYIGHSERVSGAGAELLEHIGNTIYQRHAA